LLENEELRDSSASYSGVKPCLFRPLNLVLKHILVAKFMKINLTGLLDRKKRRNAYIMLPCKTDWERKSEVSSSLSVAWLQGRTIFSDKHMTKSFPTRVHGVTFKKIEFIFTTIKASCLSRLTHFRRIIHVQSYKRRCLQHAFTKCRYTLLNQEPIILLSKPASLLKVLFFLT
jgi:hypothetical protein